MLNFVYCFDENYNSQALTSINSLTEKSSEKINLFIIHENPKSLNINLINKKNISELKVYDIEFEDIEFPNISGSHVSRATYFRFYLSKFLPDNLDFIIYIDSDILCLNDPTTVIEENIQMLKDSNYKLAARTEVLKSDKDLKVDPFSNLGMSGKKYFNAGLMIIDYQYWLENTIEESLFEIMFEYYEDIVFWDQDVLNKFFDSNYLELENICNFEIGPASNIGDINYDQEFIFNNVIFLHYSGKGKPWQPNYVFYDSSQIFQEKYRSLGVRKYLLSHSSSIKGSKIKFLKNIIQFKFLKLEYPLSYLIFSTYALFKFKRKKTNSIRTIFEDKTVERIEPKNIEETDYKLFSHELLKKIPSSFIKILKNPILINTSIFDYKKLRLYTNETFYENHTFSKKVKDTLKNLLRSKKEIVRLKNGVWIFDAKSENFGHWMIDSLCRYLLVPKDFSSFKILVPERFNISWLIEMLDYLEFPYVVLEHNKRYKIEKLVLTSRAHPSGNYNETIVNNLREIFLNKGGSSNLPKKRVWAYREHLRRRVLNFDEILPILKKYNFDIVKMEDLTIEEKINLLSQAEIISGTHGSGLINIFFMKKGTKIFEVRDYEDQLKNSVFSLASAFNIDYYYMQRDKPKKHNPKFGLLDQIDGGNINPIIFEEKLLQCINDS